MYMVLYLYVHLPDRKRHQINFKGGEHKACHGVQSTCLRTTGLQLPCSSQLLHICGLLLMIFLVGTHLGMGKAQFADAELPSQ